MSKSRPTTKSDSENSVRMPDELKRIINILNSAIDRLGKTVKVALTNDLKRDSSDYSREKLELFNRLWIDLEQNLVKINGEDNKTFNTRLKNYISEFAKNDHSYKTLSNEKQKLFEFIQNIALHWTSLKHSLEILTNIDEIVNKLYHYKSPDDSNEDIGHITTRIHNFNVMNDRLSNLLESNELHQLRERATRCDKNQCDLQSEIVAFKSHAKNTIIQLENDQTNLLDDKKKLTSSLYTIEHFKDILKTLTNENKCNLSEIKDTITELNKKIAKFKNEKNDYYKKVEAHNSSIDEKKHAIREKEEHYRSKSLQIKDEIGALQQDYAKKLEELDPLLSSQRNNYLQAINDIDGKIDSLKKTQDKINRQIRDYPSQEDLSNIVKEITDLSDYFANKQKQDSTNEHTQNICRLQYSDFAAKANVSTGKADWDKLGEQIKNDHITIKDVISAYTNSYRTSSLSKAGNNLSNSVINIAKRDADRLKNLICSLEAEKNKLTDAMSAAQRDYLQPVTYKLIIDNDINYTNFSWPRIDSNIQKYGRRLEEFERELDLDLDKVIAAANKRKDELTSLQSEKAKLTRLQSPPRKTLETANANNKSDVVRREANKLNKLINEKKRTVHALTNATTLKTFNKLLKAESIQYEAGVALQEKFERLRTGKASFFERHPTVKKVLLGAAIVLGVTALVAGIGALVFFTGGAAAAMIGAVAAPVIAKLGIAGAVTATAGAAIVTGAIAGAAIDKAIEMRELSVSKDEAHEPLLATKPAATATAEKTHSQTAPVAVPNAATAEPAGRPIATGSNDPRLFPPPVVASAVQSLADTEGRLNQPHNSRQKQ